jgi:predicted Fe-Mo cluster-binding NifX family protein
MKIAVPASGGLIDEHFGHCREFMVFSVGFGGNLSQEPSVESGEGCGCKSNLAADLSRAGVTHLVAGNMGEGALRVLSSHGIAVIRGASGDARAAAEAFARGKLVDSGGGCAGHGDGQDCER